jgi:ligand-binding SRPBCC domain-containing protein
VAYHLFEREQVVAQPLADVFGFFSDVNNLPRITPAALAFRFDEDPPKDLGVGAVVRYRLRISGIPVHWVTRITEWDPPHRFADVQARGPYAYWLHTHTFRAITPESTLARDRVIYRIPMGVAGEIARRVFVERQLKRIFDYREEAFEPALRSLVAGGPC